MRSLWMGSFFIFATAILGSFYQANGQTVAATDSNGNIYLSEWGDGSDTMPAPTVIGQNAYYRARGIGVGDFTGNGLIDTITAGYGWDDVYPVVHINNGDGTFTASQKTPPISNLTGGGNYVMDFAVGDFNHDGHLDAAMSSTGNYHVVLLGNGDGTFRPMPLGNLGYYSRGIDAADFNRDGHLDLMRGRYSDGNLYFHAGRGDGTFESPVVVGDAGSDPYGLAAGDFDGDGFVDVIASESSSGNVHFFAGLGDGTLAEPVPLPVLKTSSFASFDATDLDGDGRLDIVIAAYTEDKLLYHLNTGTIDGVPQFAAAQVYSTAADNSLGIATDGIPHPVGVPLAVVSPSAQSIALGDPMTLNGSNSSDDSAIVSHTWNPGDGTTPTTNATHPTTFTYTYASEGVYYPTLSVTDADGNTHIASASVTIVGASPSVADSTVTYDSTTARDGVWSLALDPSDFASDDSGIASATWTVATGIVEDFESGTLDNWHVLGGEWTIDSASPISGAHSLLQTNTFDNDTPIYFKIPYDQTGQDLTIEFDFQIVSGRPEFELRIGGQDWYHYNEVLLRGSLNDILLRRHYENYRNTVLDAPLPEPLAPGDTHTVRVVCRSMFMQVYLDDTLIGAMAIPHYPIGFIGFSTYDTSLRIDNLRVDRTMTASLTPSAFSSHDFESNTLTGWTATEGDWTTSASDAIEGTYSLRQNDSGASRTRLLHDSVQQDDYAVSLDSRILSGSGEELILILDYQDHDNHYELRFRGRGFDDVRLYRINNGSNSYVDAVDLPYPLNPHETHELAVVRRQGFFHVWYDDIFLGSFYDRYFAGGQVGLAGYRSVFVMDDIRIGAPPLILTLPPGSMQAELTVSDHAGQSDTGTITIHTQTGTSPVADAGATQDLDESTGVDATGYAVTLDATATTDSEDSGRLTYSWLLDTDTFPGTEIDHGKWITSPENVAQNDGITLTGTNSWSNSYLVSRHANERADGMTLEARVRADGSTMVGFKNNSSSYHYNQLAHAIYINDGRYEVYESGSDRGTFAFHTESTWLNLRIEIKAAGGARYFVRYDGESDWYPLYESSTGTVSPLRRAVTAYDGTFEIDTLTETVGGATPTTRLYGTGPHTVTLTVTDPAGNTDTDTTTITTSTNSPPVADAGDDITQNEEDATDSVWTINVNGSGSTDDYGIWIYEWDFAYDGATFTTMATGSTATHAWTADGTYTIALRVTDHANQTDLDTLTLTINNGVPPVADPGGPYSVTETSGPAFQGAWPITLDGSASSDADSSIVEYRWDYGVVDFSGSQLTPGQWEQGAGVSQNDVLIIDNPGTSNGTHYLKSSDTITRERGMAMEWRLKVESNSNAYTGLKDTDSTVNHNDFVYGFRFYQGDIDTVSYGSINDTGVDYVADTWYDLRIELKPSSGARYYYRLTGDTEWILLHDYDFRNDSTFYRAFLAYSGRLEVDDLRELAAGVSPSVRAYLPAGPRQVSVTVYDQALNTHTASTTLTLSTGTPPVANIGPDRTANETTAIDGTWTLTFSAAGSTDDSGIWTYEWDWDYDAIAGFQPATDAGRTAAHTYTSAGTYTAALRVTDHLFQSHIDTATITLTTGSEPTAVTGDPFVTELGWPATFDGTASTDDQAVSSYAWDFGDGTIGKGPVTSHVFTEVGDYTVSLTVADGAGQLSVPATQSVTVVVSTPPIADAGGPYTAGANGVPVYLNAANSTDNGDSSVAQGIVKYLWDMDLTTNSDDTGTADDDIDVTGMTAAYVYDSPGTYQIKLTVVDGAGQTDTAITTVEVTDDALHEVICVPWHGDPNAPHTAIADVPVTLKGTMRGGNGPYTYQWSFGDGSPPWPSTPETVTNQRQIEATHTYTGSAGKLFTATLTVWDSSDTPVTDTYYLRLTPDTTTARADIAIDDGLWYLHKKQETAGSWSGAYRTHRPAATASALQAFEINGHRFKGDWSEDPYAQTVWHGFDYLFSILTEQTIDMQPAGDPDTNGNGIGLTFSSSHPIYELGQVMDAIASTQSPWAVAHRGVATGRTFHDILTDMVDMYAWGQDDTGSDRGGWRYSWNNDSDNSAAQWGAIGMLAAWENFGINIPQFVHDENDNWLQYSSNGVLYGYATPNSYHVSDPTGSTASGLVQLAFNDVQHTSNRWRVTEDALADLWPFNGLNDSDYYALYAFAKAMRTARPNALPLLRKTGVNWYDDSTSGLRPKLVNEQLTNGSWYATWQGSTNIGDDLATAWAVIMLTPTLFVQPPVAVIAAPGIWGYDQELQLDASSSYHTDSLRKIVRYEWDFDGDGSWDLSTTDPADSNATITIPDPNPEIPGDEPITITVRLRVTDDNLPAQTDTVEQQILIAEPPHAPYARITSPNPVTENIPVTFDGSLSFDIDPGDFITLYEWDVDGDEVADWSGANLTSIQHTFPGPGVGSVGLRVTDNGVLNDDTPLTSEWEYRIVEVDGNLAPIARPGGPYTAYAHESLTLDGTASSDPNGNPITYEWDLETDGTYDVSTATVANTWTEAGTYTATLRVSDGALSHTATTSITILPNHLLTVESTPHAGIVIGGTHTLTTPDSQRVHDGTAVDLIAPASYTRNNALYEFQHWLLDSAEQSPAEETLSVTMLAPHTAVAVYATRQYTLTVSSDPMVSVDITGIPAGSTPYSQQLDDQSSITLTAPSQITRLGVDYAFNYWALDGSQQTAGSTLTFTLDADTDATAHYRQATHTLAVQSLPVSAVAISGNAPGATPYTETISDGDTISLTAPATNADGERFLHWLDGSNQLLTTDTTTTLTMKSDATRVAVYTTKHDTFDDNETGEMWYAYTDPAEPVHIREADQRLRLNGAPGEEGDAFYASRGWRLGVNQDFALQVDWFLNAQSADEATLEFLVAASADNSIGVSVSQSTTGRHMRVETTRFGETTFTQTIPISETSGTLYISYSVDGDTLYLSRNGYWRGADSELGDVVLEGAVTGSQNGLAATELLVALSGQADNLQIGDGDAWFDTFLLVEGECVTPLTQQLDVSSTGATGVSIAVQPGALSVPTTFTTTVDSGLPIFLEAPALHAADTFTHWEVDSSWTTDSREVELPMLYPRTAVAHYRPTHTLTVESSPVAGIPITGTHPGTTTYTATIADSGNASLTAPGLFTDTETSTEYGFLRWIVDSEPEPLDQTTVSGTITADLIAAATYTVLSTAKTPELIPDGGDFAGSDLVVEVSSPTLGATLYYTTDGSTPTTSDEEVPSNGEIVIPLPSTLRVRAFRAPWNPSPVKVAVYGELETNDPPTGVADAYTTDEDQPLTVSPRGVLTNDTDPQNQTLTARLQSSTSDGELSLQSNGGFTYTPAPGFFGTDSFVYRAFDGQAESADTTVTITVNEVPEVVSIEAVDATAHESGDTGRFVITRTGTNAQALTVQLGISGSATPGDDYIGLDTSAVINAGDWTTDLLVTPIEDAFYDPDESVILTLQPDAAYTLGSPISATVIIGDDAPHLDIDAAGQSEGDSGVSAMAMAVSLTEPSVLTTTVDFQSSGVTATPSIDYTEVSGTLTLAPGTTIGFIEIPIHGDLLHEPDETFIVTLSSPVGATLRTAVATGTIVNDDFVVASGEPVQVSETAGSGSVTVTLSNPSVYTVTIDYTLVDGTATAPADWSGADGTLTYAPGSTDLPIPFTIVDDSESEGFEDFTIHLSNPVNATIASTPITVTIVDDDIPTLTIADIQALEPGPGLINDTAVFTATLNGPGAQAITVSYHTEAGTATADVDYATTSGTLTIPAGETSGEIVVPLISDIWVEPDETFTLHLSNPVNVALGNTVATGTILDTDVPNLGLTVAPDTISEAAGEGAAVGTLTRNSFEPLTVNLASSDTSEATLPASVDFSQGQTSQTFFIHAVDDNIVDETQTVVITATASDHPTATAELQVTNDDTPTNVVYRLLLRGSRIGNNASSGTVLGIGYLVFNLDTDQVTVLSKVYHGATTSTLYNTNAMRAPGGLDSPDLWFVTNGGHLRGSPVTYWSYLQMIGREYPIEVDMGGGHTANICVTLSGDWMVGQAGQSNTYARSRASARLELGRSRAANDAGTSYSDLVSELAGELAIAPSISEEATAISAAPTSSGPIGMYLVRLSEVRVEQTNTHRQNNIGLLVIDFSTGETRLLRLFAEGRQRYYRSEDWSLTSQFANLVQSGNRTWTIMGAHDRQTDTSSFWYCYGATQRIVSGAFQADIPTSLSGYAWDHDRAVGSAGIPFRQTTFSATIRVETLYIQDLTVDEAVDFAIDEILPSSYLPAEEEEE